MCFYSLFVPAVQGCTCIGAASSFQFKCSNPNAKKCKCIQSDLWLHIRCSNPNEKKICIHSDLCLRIKCSNPNAKKENMHLICVCRSNVQMQPIKEFAYILHRALHQAIISFSNLIKLKTLWSKTYLVVIIMSVFKVGWKVRCWKVCSITILSWTGFAWSKVH